MREEEFKSKMEDAGWNLVTALENQIIGDVGVNRTSANILANHILDIIDAFSYREVFEESVKSGRRYKPNREIGNILQKTDGVIYGEDGDCSVSATANSDIIFYR